MRNDLLDQEQFFIEVWDRMPDTLVGRKYMTEYEDFLNLLTRDLYLQYLKGTSMEVIVELLQIFFYNLFNSHSSSRNLEY